MHDGSTGGFDSTRKLQDRMDFEKQQIEPMVKAFILGNTKISDDEYDENERKEWYFLADEAKKIGVVDYIIGEDCGIEEIM